MDGTLPTIPDRHVRCGGRALQTDREQTPAPRPGSTTKLNDRDRPGRNRHARRAQQPIHDPRAPASAGELGPVKNGPPLCGYGAAAMNTSLTTSMTTLREQLRKSLTWDRAGRNTPVTPSSPSIPARECSSPTRTRPGNDRQARTRTDRCASTSRRAPICPGGPPRTSKPSPWRSTTGPASSATGEPRPRSSPNSYAHCNSQRLHLTG